MEPTVAAAVIGAIVGAVSAFITAYIAIRRLPIERRNTEADTAATLTNAAGKLTAGLWEELNRLRERVETYENAITILQEQNSKNERKIAEFERRLTRAQGRIKELEAQNRKLEQENSDLREFYEKVNGAARGET